MQLPGPVRAAIGLAANVADEARHLPERAIELPMLAVSSVLQLSLRAQQRYAMLTARGDEVLGSPAGDEPPAWATFDDPIDSEPAFAPGAAADAARDASAILDEIFGSLGAQDPGDDELTPPTPITAAKRAGAKRAGAKRAGAKRAGAERAGSTSSAAKKAAARTTAKKAATKATPEKAGAPAADEARGKRVSKPRHTAPSKFDDVDD